MIMIMKTSGSQVVTPQLQKEAALCQWVSTRVQGVRDSVRLLGELCQKNWRAYFSISLQFLKNWGALDFFAIFLKKSRNSCWVNGGDVGAHEREVAKFLKPKICPKSWECNRYDWKDIPAKCVSQKRNRSNNKNEWYNILVNFIFEFN